MMMMIIIIIIIIIIPYRPHPIAGRSRKLFPVFLGGEIASLLAEFSSSSYPPLPFPFPSASRAFYFTTSAWSFVTEKCADQR